MDADQQNLASQPAEDMAGGATDRREFLAKSARRLVWVLPLIETFRARPLMAQVSTAGSAGGSVGG